MSNRNIIGIALACVACCIGPILGVIAALGVVSTLFIGLAGLALAIAASVAVIINRNRRKTATCVVTATPTPVTFTTRT